MHIAFLNIVLQLTSRMVILLPRLLQDDQTLIMQFNVYHFNILKTSGILRFPHVEKIPSSKVRTLKAPHYGDCRLPPR